MTPPVSLGIIGTSTLPVSDFSTLNRFLEGSIHRFLWTRGIYVPHTHLVVSRRQRGWDQQLPCTPSPRSPLPPP